MNGFRASVPGSAVARMYTYSAHITISTVNMVSFSIFIDLFSQDTLRYQ